MLCSKLKQIQDLRKSAREMKDALSGESALGSALGGKVQITMSGTQEIQNINIDPSLLSPENKERLEKALKDAFEGATKEIQKMLAKKMQSGELKMPEL